MTCSPRGLVGHCSGLGQPDTVGGELWPGTQREPRTRIGSVRHEPTRLAQQQQQHPRAVSRPPASSALPNPAPQLAAASLQTGLRPWPSPRLAAAIASTSPGSTACHPAAFCWGPCHHAGEQLSPEGFCVHCSVIWVPHPPPSRSLVIGTIVCSHVSVRLPLLPGSSVSVW